MKETKIAAVSDLHGNLNVAVPQCDLLVIAGDICPVSGGHSLDAQAAWLDRSFFPWCESLVDSGLTRHVVFTAGNHDNILRKHKELNFPDFVTSLIDEEAWFDGVHIYGTPWSLKFMNWHFMENEGGLVYRYRGMPEGLDILISHGPAYGVCDLVTKPVFAGAPKEHLGSKALLRAVQRVKPAWFLCGHIHTGSHEAMRLCGGATTAVNVSLLDEDYQPAYKPFEFTIREGE